MTKSILKQIGFVSHVEDPKPQKNEQFIKLISVDHKWYNRCFFDFTKIVVGTVFPNSLN